MSSLHGVLTFKAVKRFIVVTFQTDQSQRAYIFYH